MQVRSLSPTQPLSAPWPVPRHVAIIMDGNGRWARQQGLGRLLGHRAGTKNIRTVIRAFANRGVEYITLFAFSTENWRRPGHEVRGLLNLLDEVIKEETLALHQENVRVRHMGRLAHLPSNLRRSIGDALELTKSNTGLTLCVAFDYGGRDEILEAVKGILRDGVLPQDLDEALFRRYLYTTDIPDPDLIIRTGGEFRLSNFLLWQSAYSEYYSTPVFWPDFNEAEMDRALEAYRHRHRRFGTLPEE